ncbi:MAG: NYN domain-containing protein [Acholeplasma sp.]|nr:NYN domain-containing protein [Acholeplasma sp.]
MEQRKKIAVLIDYDNFNQEKYFPILFDELNEVGDILVKHAFYSNLNDGKIKDKFIKHGIEPMSQIAYSKGKNAVDIRITIEAMSLLSKEYIDCICLATSDSDFTPLVYQLQKSNKYVIGAGDNKATDTYKNTFNMFISVEKIGFIEQKNGITNKDQQKSSIESLVGIVNKIIDSNHDEEGYADFSYVVQALKNQMKDFSPKNYGANNKQSLPFFQSVLKKHYTLKKAGTMYFIKIKK